MERILEIIISKWEFIISVLLVPIYLYLRKRYKDYKGKRIKYNSEIWKLIKSTRKIKKNDFNVPHSYKLKKRPSDNKIKENLFNKKKNVILIGGKEPKLKYGKSTLLYSILKNKQLKEYIVFTPNLSKIIKSEAEIKIPAEWLESKKRKFILIVEDLHNYMDNINNLLTFYKLLEKKSSKLLFIITTDIDFDIDWGEEVIEISKIKLTPVDKINEKDFISISKLQNTYNNLEPVSKMILSFLNLYEKLGLTTSENYIYNIVEFHKSNFDNHIFREKLFILEATSFIEWQGKEIKLKKSSINSDHSNYKFVESENSFHIKSIETFFISINCKEGLYHLSNIYFNKLNFKKSKFILNEILRSDSKATKAKFLMGEVLIKEYLYTKNYKVSILDNALSWYQKAINDNNNYYKYKLSYAYALIKRGQSPTNSAYEKENYFEQASIIIEQTKSSINLDSYAYNYAYAFFYKKLEKKEVSLLYYQKLIEINYSNDNYKLFTEYGELLLQINKSNYNLDYILEIEKYLLLSLSIKPKKYYKTNAVIADFYNWRSRDPKLTLEEKNKYKELSIDNYEAAFQNSNKKYIYGLKGKAKVLISLDKNDEAISIFKDILSINPDDFYALKSIGTAYKKKHNIKKAISYYIKSIDLSIDLKYIKTLKEIRKRNFLQLFKELSSLSNEKEFIELLNYAKESSTNILTKTFIEIEIGYSKIISIKKEIDKMTISNKSIEYQLNSIKNRHLKDFKNKTLALYYIKLGDIEATTEIKIKLYLQAKKMLLNTYKKRKKKPQSYYKHLIVISSKISLINELHNYDLIIKKFEKQIKFADLTYAEIHYEFAIYLEKLLLINYDYSNNIIKCIEQFEIAYKKFSLNSYSYKEIEYCEERLIKLKSMPNKKYT